MGKRFEDLKKVINPLKGKTWGGRPFNVFVEIIVEVERKESGGFEHLLTMHGVEGPLPSGNCLGGCGQINMSIWDGQKIADGYTAAPGWDDQMLAGLFMVWDAYHLNDLRAGCQHQQDAGYTYEKNRGHVCPLCGYKIGTAWKVKNIPEDVIDWIHTLPDSQIVPAWV